MAIYRFIAGTAAAAAITLSVTSCQYLGGGNGGGSGGNPPLSVAHTLQQVVDKVDNTDTFKARISSKGNLAGVGTMSMRGTIVYRAHPKPGWRMRLNRIRVGGQPTPGGMVMIVHGDNIYLKSSRTPTGGRPWLRFPVSKIGKSSGLNGDALLNQGQQMDLTKLMKQLTASTDVRSVGDETLNGVQTTHYTGTYNVADALGKLDAQSRQQLERIYRQMGMEKLTFDLWVDAQEVPRKLTTKTLPGARTTLTTTQVFYDIGKPVSINPPPPGKVSDFSIGGGAPAVGN